MEAVQQSALLLVHEYLDEESRSPVKHEYVAGQVYAMAGSSIKHNDITLNVAAFLRDGLRGKSCRVSMAEIKLRLTFLGQEIFYYPDVMVRCDPRDSDRYFIRFPRLIIEVLSQSTERTDRLEKFLHYTQIETLQEYLLIAQDRVEVTLFGREKNWQPEIKTALHESVQLRSIDLCLPLRTIYDQVL